MANIKDIILTNKEVNATTSSVNVEGDLTDKPIIATLSNGDVTGSVSDSSIKASLTNKALSSTVDDFLLNISINGRIDRHPTLFKKIIDDIIVYDAITNTLLDYGNNPLDNSLTSDITEFLVDFNREIVDEITHVDVFNIGFDKVNEEYLSNFEIISKSLNLVFNDLVVASESFNATFDFQGLFQNPLDTGSMVEDFLSVLTAQRSLQDNLSTANYLSFDASIVLSDLSEATDTLITHPSMVLSDLSSSTDSLVFSIGLALSDLVDISENIMLEFAGDSSYNPTDTSNNTEVITFTWSALRSFLEELAVSETISTNVDKVLNDNSTMSEVVSTAWTAMLDRQEDLVHTDTVTFGLAPSALDNITLSETLSLLWDAQLLVNENVFSTETITSMVGKELSDLVSFVEDIQKTLSVLQSDLLASSEVASFDVNAVFNDLVNLTEDFNPVYMGSGNYDASETSSISEDFVAQWTAFVSFNENALSTETIDKSIFKYPTDELVSLSETIIKEMGYGLLFNDTSSHLETLSFDASKVSTENLISSEDISKSISNVFSDNSITSETLSTLWTILPTYNENVISSEVAFTNVGKVFSAENLISTEVFNLTINNAYSELITSAETFSFVASINLSDNVLTSENISKAIGDDRWDDDLTNIALTETFSPVWTIVKDFQDNHTLTETITKTVDLVPSENASLTEAINKDLANVYTDNTLLTETFEKVWAAQFEAYEYPLSSEAYSFDIGKVIAETSTISEVFTPVWTAQSALFDYPLVSEEISKSIGKVYSDPDVLTSHVVSKDVNPQFSETSNNTESFILDYVKQLSEDILLTEALTTDLTTSEIEKALEDFTTLSEEMLMNIDNYLNENLVTSEERVSDVSKVVSRGSLVIDAWGDSIHRTADLPSLSNYTISGWFKLVNSNHATYQYIFNISGTVPTTNVHAFQLYRPDENIANHVYRVGNTNIQTALSTQPSNRYDTWMYASLSSNGTTQTVRLWDSNGNLIDSESQAPNSFTPSKICVGPSPWTSSENAYGTYAHVRVWDAVLTQTELETEMFSLVPVKTTSLNTAFVDSGTDISGNGRDWTSVNTTYSFDSPLSSDLILTNETRISDVSIQPTAFNQSALVNANGDRIYRDANLPSNINISACGWTKLSSPLSVPADINVIFSLDNTIGAGWFLFGYSGNNNKLEAARYDGVGSENYLFTVNPSIGEWFAWGISVNGSGYTARWWNASGVLQASYTLTLRNNAFSVNLMSVGTDRPAWSEEAYGKYANVRVWDAALTQAELEAEIKSSSPRRLANINTAFKADPTVDVSGNSRPWTVNSITVDNEGPPVLDEIVTSETRISDVSKLPSRGSIVIDANGDYIARSSADGNLPVLLSFTASGWMYLTSNASEPVIFHLRSSSGDQKVGFDSSGTGCFISRNLGVRAYFDVVFPLNQWIYFAIACDGTAYDGYWWDMDGVLGGSVYATDINASNGTSIAIAIGSYIYYDPPLVGAQSTLGKYSCWKIWDSKLSQAELEAEMFSTTPIKKISLNTAFIDNGADISGNGHNWNLNSTLYSHDAPVSGEAVVSNEIRINDVSKDPSYAITVASDDFNRADGSLTGNWTTFTSTGAGQVPDILSNKLVPKSGYYDSAAQWTGTNSTFYNGIIEGDITFDTNCDDDSVVFWARNFLCYFGHYGGSTGDLLIEAPNNATLYNNSYTPAGLTYSIRIQIFERSISVYVDNILIYSGNSAVDSAPGEIGVQFNSSGTYRVSLDNYKISSYDIDKATTSESFILDYIKDLLDEIALTESIVTDLVTSDLEKLLEELLNTSEEIPKDVNKHLLPLEGSIEVSSDANILKRSANLPSSNAVTMCGWVKLLPSTSGTDRYICGIGGNGYGPGIWQWFSNNRFYAVDATIGTALDPEPPENEWIYIAYTRTNVDSSRAYWWNSQGIIQSIVGSNSAGNFTVEGMSVGGRGYYNNARRNGLYRNWRVWDAVLTEEEMRAEMFSSTPVRTTSLNTAFVDDNIDISGNGRDWTVTTPTYSTDSPLGSDDVAVIDSRISNVSKEIIKGSLLVNSNTDKIIRTTNLPPNKRIITMAGWVKRSSADVTSNWCYLAGIKTGDTEEIVIGYVESYNNNAFRIWHWDADVLLSAPLPLNVWVYVALTSNGPGTNTIKGYWWNSNGTLGGSAQLNGATRDGVTSRGMTVGTHPDSNQHVPGNYAHWRVWDIALTQAELEAEMFSPVPIKTTSLNTAFADNQTDISGNGRDWTFTNISGSADAPYLALEVLKSIEIRANDVSKVLNTERSGAIRLDAADGNGLRRTTDLPTSNLNFSVGGWTKLRSTCAFGTYVPVFTMLDSGAATYGGLICEDSNIANMYFGWNGTGGWLEKVTGVTAETWFYWAFSCAGTGVSDVKCYVWNEAGTLVFSYTGSGAPLANVDPWDTMYIGGNVNNKSIYGDFSQIRLWNAVLSQAEFETELASPTIVRTANIYNAISGGLLGIDVSGNGRNWTDLYVKGYKVDGPSNVSLIGDLEISESGILNLQNYVDGGYLASDFVGTNTTF